MKIVLLPGMDGTGELFAAFVAALPETISAQVVRYPTDRFMSYADLEALVQSELPASEPFVLLAESFSTPLAIALATKNPPNLKALILCAGFASSPVRGLQRSMLSLLAPIVFRVPLSKPAIRSFLAGSDAPGNLIEAVYSAVRLARPAVLSSRLRAIVKCDVRSRLTQISGPILYLQACQDRLVGDGSAQEIFGLNPKVTLLKIDAPHLLLQRMPEHSAKLIAHFIEEI
jgi:pimeloyl-ACP methyl ester carboxylesterase